MKFLILLLFSMNLLHASDQGFVSFKFSLKKDYFNGAKAPKDEMAIIKLPGLADFKLSRKPATTLISWEWDKGIKDVLAMNYPVAGLPSGDYHILATWDAKSGYFNMYLNGSPMRLPKTKVQAWKMPKIDLSSIKTNAFIQGNRFISCDKAKDFVPGELYGKNAQVLGAGSKTSAINFKKDKLVYSCSMANKKAVSNWRAEGPVKMAFVDGACQLSSEFPDAPKPGGHITYWAPICFPANFIAEWEVKIESKNGLNIVFFAAKGINGHDIFHQSIKKRDGVFHKYTRSDINSYHISYYADNPILLPGRIASNLRKNSGFYLVKNGKIGIKPGDKSYHKMTLIKSGNHIQMMADGHVFMDYIDDDKTYGASHLGGRIGLRQMQWSICRYRNFKVWSIGVGRKPGLDHGYPAAESGNSGQP